MNCGGVQTKMDEKMAQHWENPAVVLPLCRDF
jgi:hypothetical protein